MQLISVENLQVLVRFVFRNINRNVAQQKHSNLWKKARERARERERIYIIAADAMFTANSIVHMDWRNSTL